MDSALLLSLTFGVALLESLAIVGLLLPGVAFIFLLSAAAASDQIPFVWLLIVTFLGALLGDSISYWFGRAMQDRIYILRPIKNNPLLIEKSKRFFARYGALSLLVGRFIGPLRPFMPMTAGVLKYPKHKFIAIAFVGALIWAPAYLAPGYYLGRQPGIDFQVWLLIGLCIFVPELILWLKQHIARAEPQLLMVSATLSFSVLLLLGITLAWPGTNRAAQLISNINQEMTNGLSDTIFASANLKNFLQDIAYGFSFTANPLIATVILVLTGFFSVKKIEPRLQLTSQRLYYQTFGFILLSIVLMYTCKLVFNLDRPLNNYDMTETSFPSGHTFFAFLIFFLLPTNIKSAQRLTAYWAAGMGLSRMVLEVHWFLDIIGGILLAFSMTCIFQFIINSKIKNTY